jgi:hypothetical protein
MVSLILRSFLPTLSRPRRAAAQVSRRRMKHIPSRKKEPKRGKEKKIIRN